MISPRAVSIESVSHFYGKRQALTGVTLSIDPGEIFVFLGPNGGGKSTLFRLLSTLMSLSHGDISILGRSVRTHQHEVRQQIGVVFQMPSLDKKLTVLENIHQQAALYGITGALLQERTALLLDKLELEDRKKDIVEDLSGGLRRRVELAKGMLHSPKVLLLDEPSTGLDPAARQAMWRYLESLRTDQGVTVILTSHLLEEAEKADRIAILDQGKLVALDTPDALKDKIGGDTITIRSRQPQALIQKLRDELNLNASEVSELVRLETEDGPAAIRLIMQAASELVDAITLAKPSLEDVFIAMTGRQFTEEVTP
ncbi:Daunorubicin/doxorubicin resistance ATP-binding protein DrrA [Bremerella volcania]|uniref:Daunorubicin/doxorubicin resistance ATP-binding protein DrrA n=1 Tax=Bremerella volcania TaxID=2527984 RepID=A0A518C4M7_9BACT|nr:ATP-binding cassette domain-containing protein [Bremerella volcania]QDU74180.1 Daunorubicin/doxorubicin resistance ATP-binding protein DrrA [Bremerella volcania]